jgi:hypothetical protein
MVDPYTKEILDRCRRIETRLTRYLEREGMDTKVQRPIWNNGLIHINSLDTSLRDIVALIPPTWDPDASVKVYHHDQEILEVFKGLS